MELLELLKDKVKDEDVEISSINLGLLVEIEIGILANMAFKGEKIDEMKKIILKIINKV
ncbi:hypothetical protein BGX27_001641, partial [Mortierella sp. AM989]